METVNEIRKALDAATQGEWKAHKVEGSWHDKWVFTNGFRSIDDLSEADATLFASAPAWLRQLLPVIAAVREIVADADTPHLARNWATDRLQAALAALDSDGGGE